MGGGGRAAHQGELSAAVEGRASPEEAAYRLYELLAKADYENARDRPQGKSMRGTPNPRRSTKWVDWY